MKTDKPKMSRKDFDSCLARLLEGENSEQPALFSLKADLGNMSDEGSGWLKRFSGGLNL